MSQSTEKQSGYFNIKQVAKKIGVSTSTIRNWEKANLFKAQRSTNGYRIYSISDIETLKKIKYYSIEKKMSINSIQAIMNPPIVYESMGNDKSPAQTREVAGRQLVGKKWKECRLALGQTLEEVANNVSISVSYLSKIENGQANISYEMLEKLAYYYGKSVLYFFEPESEEERIVYKGKGERISTGLEGVTIESLIAIKDRVLSPMMFHIEPGCGSDKPQRHNGEEFLHILEGELQVILNHNEVYRMYEGDSFYFKSYDYHSWCNPGKSTAKILWIHSPIEKTMHQ